MTIEYISISIFSPSFIALAKNQYENSWVYTPFVVYKAGILGLCFWGAYSLV